jgi:hypothetical protein
MRRLTARLDSLELAIFTSSEAAGTNDSPLTNERASMYLHIWCA